MEPSGAHNSLTKDEKMYTRSQQIPEGTLCDMCDKNQATLGCLCQGATGRVCEVMWICDECGPQDETKIHDPEEAAQNIQKYFGENATADF